MSSYITVGRIIKTHGLKGAFKLRPYNLSSRFYEYAPEVYIKQGETYISHTIEHVQFFKELLILKISGCLTIEIAETLRGQELFVKEDVIPVADDEILLRDLISFEAFFNGEQLGNISAVTNYGAGDIYVVESESGQKYFLPDQDAFVKEIDYDQCKIIFQDIDILL